MKQLIPNEILLAEVGRLLEEGREVELMTKGNSMHPHIIGDLDSVILKKMQSDSLRAGDIVLAEVGPGQYVLHRIIRLEGPSVTLMGDGNVSGTEHCRVEKVLGTAVTIIKPSGRKVKPGRACLWRRLGAFPRAYILAAYRKTLFKLIKNRYEHKFNTEI